MKIFLLLSGTATMYLNVLSLLTLSDATAVTSFVAHVLRTIRMEYVSRSLFSSARLVAIKSCVLLSL